MGNGEFNNHSDHDLLIILVTKVEALEKQFSNHLRHHFVYTLALFTALLSVVGAAALVLMKIGG